MPLCACCSHPSLAEIDAAIVAGGSIRTIAARYGMSHTSVKRHKAHISAALVTLEAAARKGGADLSAMDELRDILPRLKRVLDVAEAAKQTGNVLQAARDIRPWIELLAKLTHELDTRPVTVVNLQSSPEWLAVRAVILSALMDYPEARACVAGRLLQLEAGPS